MTVEVSWGQCCVQPASARLGPKAMLGQMARASSVIAQGHAFVQNLRRGHYELAIHAPAHLRVAAAFTELASAL